MHGPQKNSNSVAASLHAKQKNSSWKLTISMDLYKEVYLNPLADVLYRHCLRSVVMWQGRCYFDHFVIVVACFCGEGTQSVQNMCKSLYTVHHSTSLGGRYIALTCYSMKWWKLDADICLILNC